MIVSYSMIEPEWEPVCECRYDPVHDRMDREDCFFHCDLEEEVAKPEDQAPEHPAPEHQPPGPEIVVQETADREATSRQKCSMRRRCSRGCSPLRVLTAVMYEI